MLVQEGCPSLPSIVNTGRKEGEVYSKIGRPCQKGSLSLLGDLCALSEMGVAETLSTATSG